MPSLAGVPSRIALVLLTAAMLTLAFPPFGQFYLAWVALVPLLLIVEMCESPRAAAGLGMLAGLLFWSAIAAMTGKPAALVLGIVAAATWTGVAAISIATNDDDSGPWRRLARIATIAAAWVCGEWLCDWLTPATGARMFCLADSQLPWTSMWQVAELGGLSAIGFLVVALNAAIAVTIANVLRRRRNPAHDASPLPLIVTSLLIVVAATYGSYRLDELEQMILTDRAWPTRRFGVWLPIACAAIVVFTCARRLFLLRFGKQRRPRPHAMSRRQVTPEQIGDRMAR